MAAVAVALATTTPPAALLVQPSEGRCRLPGRRGGCHRTSSICLPAGDATAPAMTTGGGAPAEGPTAGRQPRMHCAASFMFMCCLSFSSDVVSKKISSDVLGICLLLQFAPQWHSHVCAAYVMSCPRAGLVPSLT